MIAFLGTAQENIVRFVQMSWNLIYFIETHYKIKSDLKKFQTIYGCGLEQVFSVHATKTMIWVRYAKNEISFCLVKS